MTISLIAKGLGSSATNLMIGSFTLYISVTEIDPTPTPSPTVTVSPTPSPTVTPTVTPTVPTTPVPPPTIGGGGGGGGTVDKYYNVSIRVNFFGKETNKIFMMDEKWKNATIKIVGKINTKVVAIRTEWQSFKGKFKALWRK